MFFLLAFLKAFLSMDSNLLLQKTILKFFYSLTVERKRPCWAMQEWLNQGGCERCRGGLRTWRQKGSLPRSVGSPPRSRSKRVISGSFSVPPKGRLSNGTVSGAPLIFSSGLRKDQWYKKHRNCDDLWDTLKWPQQNYISAARASRTSWLKLIDNDFQAFPDRPFLSVESNLDTPLNKNVLLSVP